MVFSDAVFTNFTPMSEDGGERLLTLKPSAGNASQTLNVLAAFEKAPAASCASNKSVEVSCQSFSTKTMISKFLQAF
jgi:hypothetical protein